METSSPDRSPPRGKMTVALIAFTATTFVSAFLLFLVQPMFAKMALPVLGGAASVWAVALLFFQGALLTGYCYAHLLIRFVPVKRTGLIHLGLYALAVLALPIALPAGWTEPPPGDPYLWQLGLFAAAVGLPFVAVAANAPLLQAWFAATGHPNGRDPYFLYAASNLGSLVALLGYPFLFEPAFGLAALSGIWTGGFAVLAAALALCFWIVRLAPNAISSANPVAGEGLGFHKPTVQDRLGWVGLAFVPSALLTAFTTHIVTDIASAPLLWVLPLSLYLLTFVIVFQERALIPMPVLLVLHLAAVTLAILQLSQTKHDTWMISSTLGVVAFFTASLVAHRTLYEARPPARSLTGFYLWMSFGGVLGGLFAALIAPKLFSEVFEYPLLLALSMACRPRSFLPVRGRTNELVWLSGIFAFGVALLLFGPLAAQQFGLTFGEWGTTAAIALLFALGMLANWRAPPRQLAFALLMFGAVVILPSAVKKGDAQRSYFGVYRVSLSEDGQFNILTHGTTLHGAQRVFDSEGKSVADTTPGTYYHPESPMAKSVDIARAAAASRGELGRFGVIGLGSGSLACLSEKNEAWRFFEIDPVIAGIASKSGWFTYLLNCQPDADIVMGDARLTMGKETDSGFDLVIVDAFSSDAVPVHLMTVEALTLFASKIKDRGVLVLHISNRYLDLEAVVGATLASVPGTRGLVVSDDTSDGTYATSTSTVVVVAKHDDVLDPFRLLNGAYDLKRGQLRAWTDDYSDILGPFLSHLRQ